MPPLHHRYYVGLLPWELTLDERSLSVKALWGRKVVPRDRVTKVGIAHDLPAVTKHEIRLGDQILELAGGPYGLLIVYEDDSGKQKDVHFTFDPTDPPAVKIVEAILADGPEKFHGVGPTHILRAQMGFAAGDMLGGLILFLVIGAIVALLMYLGILN